MIPDTECDAIDITLDIVNDYVKDLVRKHCCYPNILEAGLSELEILASDDTMNPDARDILMRWLDEHRNHAGLDIFTLQRVINSRGKSYLLDFAVNVYNENSGPYITTFCKLVKENKYAIVWRYQDSSGFIADEFPTLDKNMLNSISEEYYDLINHIDISPLDSYLEQDEVIPSQGYTKEDFGNDIAYKLDPKNVQRKSPLSQEWSGLKAVSKETGDVMRRSEFIANKMTCSVTNSIINAVKKASDFELNTASLSVSALVNVHLGQNKPTPLYFRKEKVYETIINLKIDQFITSNGKKETQTLLEINEAKNNLAILNVENENKLNNNPYILAYAWEVFNNIANTDPHLFDGIDFNKLFFSDLIYSYRDRYGRAKEDAISIVDYLCSKATNHPITARQNVSLSWPKEIAPQKTYSLTSFLQEEAENLLVHLDQALLLKNIEQKKDIVSQAIEKPSNYFQTILNKLLSKYPNHPKVTLADTVQYNNRVSMINMNYQGAANYATPSVSLTFSVADILAGRVREWESTHISYNSPDFSRLGKISTELLNDLQNENIQPQYVSLLRALRANTEVKKDFYSYLSSILQFHGVNQTGSYTIEQAPLLLVYPNPGGGPSLSAPSSLDLNQEHDPIQVVSLQTNDAITFPSSNDFRQQIRQDEELRKWVALHFPADFSADYGDLKIGGYKTDYSGLFERMINQYADDMDVWVRSASEAGALKAFAIIEMLSPVFILPSFVMTPVVGFIYGAAVAATPHLGRAAVSDTDEERDGHLESAAIAVALEAVFQMGFQAAASTITKAAGRFSLPSSRVVSNMPDAKARGFKVQGHQFTGRVQNGRFEVSSNNGRIWNKGGKVAEFAWRMQNAGPGAKKLPQPEAAGTPPAVPPRPAGTLDKPPFVPPRPPAAGKNVFRELEEAPVRSASEIELFTNKQPNSFQEEVAWASTHAKGPFRRGDSRFNELIDSKEDFKWVLTSDRNIVIGRDLSHAVLGNSENVISAGHAKKIADGKLWVSNQTGHYQANYESIKQSIHYWKELGYIPHVDGDSEIINNGYLNLLVNY